MSGLGRKAIRCAADFDTGPECSGGVQQEPQVASVAQPASVNRVVGSDAGDFMSSSKRQHHLELWLALLKLESYHTGRLVLNNARQRFFTAPAIWITTAKHEEAHGNIDIVAKIIDRAIISLTANGVMIDRDFWLKEAEAAERSQPPMIATCQACVKAVIGRGIEQQDWQRIWMADAEEAIKQGSVETARTIYQHAVTMFPGQEYIWHQAALLEKSNGTRDSLDTLLQKALVFCPQAEVLQLMLDRE